VASVVAALLASGWSEVGDVAKVVAGAVAIAITLATGRWLWRSAKRVPRRRRTRERPAGRRRDAARRRG